MNPCLAAWRVTSVTSRVLPTPASPPMRATTAWPDAASSRSVSRRANSAFRPTSRPRGASGNVYQDPIRAGHSRRINRPGQIVSVGMEKVVLSDAEWRERLAPEEYKVLRQAGTEAPWDG